MTQDPDWTLHRYDREVLAASVEALEREAVILVAENVSPEMGRLAHQIAMMDEVVP
jgi:hypothetical protein